MYFFDKYKNKIEYNEEIVEESIALTPVELFDRLKDNDIIVYDRGAEYGNYGITMDNELIRLSEGTDDGTADSQNWRYLICEEYDLPHYDSDVGNTTIDEYYRGKTWGKRGVEIGGTFTDIGAGWANTNKVMETYPSETDYMWYYINKHRTETGKQWFLPSKDELNILYENKDTIGNFSVIESYYYWSSSEYSNLYYCWVQLFKSGIDSGHQTNMGKTTTDIRIRLIRRL